MPRKKPSAAAIPKTDAQRTREQDRYALKRKVRMYYDLQRMRLQCAGRLNKNPHGIDLHEIDLAILDRRAQELHSAEKAALGDVQDHLKQMPFYEKVLSDKERYKGIGPTMAGVILAEFDIHREDTVSKMWSFAGLKPLPARRCEQCHDIVVIASEEQGTYTHRDKKSKCKLAGAPYSAQQSYESGMSQRPTKGEKLPYNAWLRTKLVGVLGPVMLKVGSPWKKVYDDYKHRKASQGWGKSDAHRHQAAIRFMVKMLLLDIWKRWREFEGLVVREPYGVEKLHMPPHSSEPPFTRQPKDRREPRSDFTEAEIEAEAELIEEN